MADTRSRPATARARKKAIRRWIPPQHGAWAMLVVPFIAGILVSRASWLHVPLLLAWIGGYLWSYYALLAVKTRTVARVRRQMIWYGSVAAVAAAVVVLARPAVLWFAPVFAVLSLVSVYFARRHDDRSLRNDVALVGQAGAMVFVSASVGGMTHLANHGVWLAFSAVFGYFVGTVLYVKTMIRERGERGFLAASVGYHVACAAVLAGLAGVVFGPTAAAVLGVVFGWYAVRAWLFPRRTMTPKDVGLIEIGSSIALLIALGVVVG